jgi:sporulation protein YlmC with PRC-barrel domain
MALIKLRDSDRPRDATAKALLDGDVYGQDGEKIGSVKDLYVDAEEGEMRFLDVGAGGFLGLGEKHFMIPIEAVTDSRGGAITIEHTSVKVEGLPELDIKGVPEDAYQQEVYDYFGYPNPRSPYPGAPETSR